MELYVQRVSTPRLADRGLSAWMSEDWGGGNDILPHTPRDLRPPREALWLQVTIPRGTACPASASKSQPRPHVLPVTKLPRTIHVLYGPDPDGTPIIVTRNSMTDWGSGQAWGGYEGPNFCPRKEVLKPGPSVPHLELHVLVLPLHTRPGSLWNELLVRVSFPQSRGQTGTLPSTPRMPPICLDSCRPQQNVGTRQGELEVWLRDPSEGRALSELHGRPWKVSLPPRGDAGQPWVSPHPPSRGKKDRASTGCAFHCQGHQPPPWPLDRWSPWWPSDSQGK